MDCVCSQSKCKIELNSKWCDFHARVWKYPLHRNLNIFKNLEHVYWRHPFDVSLPLRAKGFIAFSITINTTQFPFSRYMQTLIGMCWEETSKKKMLNRKYYISLDMACRHNDENDDQSYIRIRSMPMRNCLVYQKDCMACTRPNRPNLLGNLISFLERPVVALAININAYSNLTRCGIISFATKTKMKIPAFRQIDDIDNF